MNKKIDKHWSKSDKRSIYIIKDIGGNENLELVIERQNGTISYILETYELCDCCDEFVNYYYKIKTNIGRILARQSLKEGKK